ncbi:hypothetical protein CMI43_03280 [Candidatus Pacearchaeota archaeon]|nr:hypothetical protein [Candidatus Pacearchaeota archaeon]
MFKKEALGLKCNNLRKMKSIFLKKQGESPKNKVLDFLITNSELDYSLKEIANYSGAGYSTIKILIKKLVKGKWIIPTRKISKVILYKLNTENPEVKIFIEFYWKVISWKHPKMGYETIGGTKCRGD